MRKFLSPTLILGLVIVGRVSFGEAKTDKCDYDKIKKDEPKLSLENFLFRSVEESCPTLMEAALKNETPEAVLRATKGFTEKVLKHFADWVQQNKGKLLDDDALAAVVEEQKRKRISMTALKSFLEEKCPVEGGSSEACKVRKIYAAFNRQLSKLLDAAAAQGEADEARAREEGRKSDPEYKFKMKMCKSWDLYEILYGIPTDELGRISFNGRQAPIESKCIYELDGQTKGLYVVQSAEGGILVGAGPPGKVIFIRTKKQYADGDKLQNQFVRSIGLKKYRNPLGVQNTVNSFQYLGDAFPAKEGQ